MLRGLIFYIDILPFFLLAFTLDLGPIFKKETQRTPNIGILRLLFAKLLHEVKIFNLRIMRIVKAKECTPCVFTLQLTRNNYINKMVNK